MCCRNHGGIRYLFYKAGRQWRRGDGWQTTTTAAFVACPLMGVAQIANCQEMTVHLFGANVHIVSTSTASSNGSILSRFTSPVPCADKNGNLRSDCCLSTQSLANKVVQMCVIIIIYKWDCFAG